MPTRIKAGIYHENRTSKMFIVDNGYNTYDSAFIYGEMDSAYIFFNADMEVAGDLTCTALFEVSDQKFKKSIKIWFFFIF